MVVKTRVFPLLKTSFFIMLCYFAIRCYEIVSVYIYLGLCNDPIDVLYVCA